MSATAVVNAEKREERGKGPARRLRQRKLIPAVVYGLAKPPTHLAVDPAQLQHAIATARKFNTLLTLKTPDGDKLVLFKDYQVDPVSRRLLHADFLEVTLDKPVKVEVPVVVGRQIGSSVAIREGLRPRVEVVDSVGARLRGGSKVTVE